MGMKTRKYVIIWNFTIKNIHLNQLIVFADVDIFANLDKTEWYHLVTKIMLFGNVILISDAELSSKGY